MAVLPTKNSPTKGTPATPAKPISFVRAAHEHVEPGGIDVTVTPGAGAVTNGPFDVPAYGYIKNICLLVTATGGTIGAGTLATDFPFNIFDEVVLFDINGAPIYGPSTGWDLFLANLIGGYVWWPDPRMNPGYAGNAINFAFLIRVPVEVTPWDGYGALPNESAAAAFKLRFTVTASANLFPTAPTTVPAVRVRSFLEAWSHPAAKDVFGQPQATTPPGVMTIQYWSQFVKTINAGANTMQFIKVGNLIRNFALQARSNTASQNTTLRDSTVFPDPVTVNWDNRQLHSQITQFHLITWMAERLGLLAGLTAPVPGGSGAVQAAGIIPAGFFALDYTHDTDGHIGWEARNLWLPTSQATRFEMVGNSATAGTIKLLTNDVAPVGGR